jgi:succinate-acetate transporter protein
MAEQVAKPVNPAPLGLVAFGLTTVVLSIVNAGLAPKDAEPVVFPLAFAFGGVAQIVAGSMEFKNGNTFGTVAFTSYGLFW